MAAAAISSRVDKHRESLLKLWKENFDNPRMADVADERFDWLYRENPFGSTRTWLAVDNTSNDVIGCASVFPSNRYVGGRMVRTGVTVDFAVDREYRTAGVALALQRALTSESRRAGFACLIGKPNRKASAIFDRVGYQPIGDAQDWVKCIGCGVEVPDRRAWSFYSDTIVNAADERFDRLWSAGRCHYQIVGEKTAGFLNWRYSSFKEQSYRFYCLLHGDDCRLVGYLCFSAAEKTVFVGDVFLEEPDPAIVDRLLLGLAAVASREGHAWIGLSYLGARWFEDCLERLGFTHGRHRRKLLGYVHPDATAGLRDEIFDQDKWFIFAGEMDLF
jgi:GNAT superfamily N-acetyltransferase